MTGYTKLAAVLVLTAAVGAVSCSDSDGPSEPSLSGSSQSPVPEPPLSTLLVLPTTVVQGDSIVGSLKVTNRSADALNLRTDTGCHPHWVVVLRNSAVAGEYAFSSECSGDPLVFAPGATDLSVTISSRFSTCRPTASSPSTDGAPACQPDGSQPPLPVGEYEAVFFSDSSGFPEPPPVTVQIVAR